MIGCENRRCFTEHFLKSLAEVRWTFNAHFNHDFTDSQVFFKNQAGRFPDSVVQYGL